jgi:hypothetical protein
MGLLVMSKQFNSRKEMEADARREDRALARKSNTKSKALAKAKRAVSRETGRPSRELDKEQGIGKYKGRYE